MSKAIFVIDLPDNLNNSIDEIRVDIRANLYGNDLLDWRNQTIKLIPEKISPLDVPSIYKDFGNAFSLARGYNACIDEIIEVKNHD